MENKKNSFGNIIGKDGMWKKIKNYVDSLVILMLLLILLIILLLVLNFKIYFNTTSIGSIGSIGRSIGSIPVFQ